MYDLHAHILPGVDDGAKTPEETLNMARIAVAEGTKVMLATPHRRDITENWSVGYVQDLLHEMNEKLHSGGIELDLRLGMENHLDIDLPDELSAGRALPMNGSRYILVELPFFGRPIHVEDTLFRVQLAGRTPVLAHPERIETFQQSPELLATFVNAGMLSQITASSITGHFGKRVQRFTKVLIQRGLVHIVASDTHSAEGPRTPKILRGLDVIAGMVGGQRARAMVVDTPKAILEDLPVEVEPPVRNTTSRRWWRFWGGRERTRV